MKPNLLKKNDMVGQEFRQDKRENLAVSSRYRLVWLETLVTDVNKLVVKLLNCIAEQFSLTVGTSLYLVHFGARMNQISDTLEWF